MAKRYITVAGRVVTAKAMAGEVVTYTKLCGSGVLVANPEQLEGLPTINQTAEGLVVTQVNEHYEISGTLRCQTLEADYTLKMVGLYGRTPTTSEKLLQVFTYDTGGIPLTAGENLELNLKILGFFDDEDGEVEITISPLASAPAAHVSDAHRHLFTQINNHALPATVNHGNFKDFVDEQRIVFVPKISMMTGNARLKFPDREIPIIGKNRALRAHNFEIIPYQEYTLVYKNGEFWCIDTDSRKMLNGVDHYWDSLSGDWKTVIPSGIVGTTASWRVPAGALLCNGEWLDKTVWPELFIELGYNFGGIEGENIFKLPETRDFYIKGAKTPFHLGYVSGAPNHSIQLLLQHMPKHKHNTTASSTTKVTQPDANLVGGFVMGGSIGGGGPYKEIYVKDSLPSVAVTTSILEIEKGNGEAFNIEPHNLSLNFYIYTGRPQI